MGSEMCIRDSPHSTLRARTNHLPQNKSVLLHRSTQVDNIKQSLCSTSLKPPPPPSRELPSAYYSDATLQFYNIDPTILILPVSNPPSLLPYPIYPFAKRTYPPGIFQKLCTSDNSSQQQHGITSYVQQQHPPTKPGTAPLAAAATSPQQSLDKHYPVATSPLLSKSAKPQVAHTYKTRNTTKAIAVDDA